MRPAFLTAALLLCVVLSLPARGAEPPPNIVVILADDMGYGDPGCYNPASKIPTPHIDRLAREGKRFTDAHSPSGVCTPTRYGLLTGRYAWRTRLKRGVLQGYDPLLIEPGRPTIASVLKGRGYRTAAIGKWHLGFGEAGPLDYAKPLRPGPVTVGFDSFFGIPSSLDFVPYVFVENDRPLEQPTETIAGSASQREGGGGFWRGGPIAPNFRHADVLPKTTERAVAFLRQQTSAKPFFLYFPLSAPHTPWLPAPEFRGKSGAGPFGDFAMQADATVGKVLQALDDAKLAQNTLVVYTSDNGGHWLPADIEQYGHRSNLNWRGQKADVWEGGHRVPFLVRWPEKVRPGSRCDQTVGLVDLFATCIAAAGAVVPGGSGEDSFNLLGLLTGAGERPVRGSLVHHSGEGLFGIRAGEWKMVEGLGSGGFTPPRTEMPSPSGPIGQLYNLTADPGEQRNLYLEKPDEVKRLQALLDRTRDSGRTPR